MEAADKNNYTRHLHYDRAVNDLRIRQYIECRFEQILIMYNPTVERTVDILILSFIVWELQAGNIRLLQQWDFSNQ